MKKSEIIKLINENLCLYYLNKNKEINNNEKHCDKIVLSKEEIFVNNKNIIYKCPIQFRIELNLESNDDSLLFMHNLLLIGLLQGETQSMDTNMVATNYFTVRVKNQLVNPNFFNWSFNIIFSRKAI